jgi:hypothetical protein
MNGSVILQSTTAFSCDRIAQIAGGLGIGNSMGEKATPFDTNAATWQ